MQVQRTDISETKVKLTVELGLEDLAHAKQHELEQQAKNIKVTGFRKGKAPLNLVENQLDQNQLQANVINHAVNDSYSKAVEEQKLKTLNQPEVSIEKFVPYSELVYITEVEVMPNVKLGDYKKIKKTMPKITVSEKEVNDVVESLRGRMAVKEDSAHAAQNGDDVIIDFSGKDGKNQPVAGASGKDYELNLGSKTFIPGFEEGLVGAKKGDKKELKLKFPKDYHAKNLAGSNITFDVEVKNVRSVKLPKLDDKLASSVGPFTTLLELKKDIKKQLTEQKTTEALNKVKDEIVEELVKSSKFAMPEILVNDQIAMLENDFNQNLLYRGITKQEYLKQEGFKDEDSWKQAELKPQAERRVAVGIILSAVAEAEQLQVSQQELAQRLEVYRNQYAQQAEQFDTPEMQREVISRILTEKTVNLLADIALKK